MNRIRGQTVLVTGASSGIGRACARAFAERGARLVLAARRMSRLERLASELRQSYGSEPLQYELDVRDRGQVEGLRRRLEEEGALPDVLINNAGKALGLEPLHEGDADDWDEMLDTNVKGLLYVARAFLPHMVDGNRGHVVLIGSTAGRWTYPGGSVYSGSKYAVKAISEGMNLDLAGTRVRVSSIDPGLVETEFSEVRFHGDTDRAASVYAGMQPLTPEDVADVVCYVVNAPEHVDIFNVVLMPTDQRHSMVVHRNQDGP